MRNETLQKFQRKVKGRDELERLVRKEKARTMEQTKAYERLKRVLPIHPYDTTRCEKRFINKQGRQRLQG